ncbi:MAG: DUF3576 domain-containing protein [Pseudomonadota bacterium]
MSMKKRNRMWAGLTVLSALAVSGCGGERNEYAAEEREGPRPGPVNRYDPNDPSVFGEGGFTFNRLATGAVFDGRTPGESDAIPVNKYLWQASLDTLSFLPLESTDPFTGVIATDWGASPSQPSERFKVTAYMVRPALQASSLKVAVYREVRSEEGTWVPAPVDPATARQLEDAILVRARQMRIAELEGDTTG